MGDEPNALETGDYVITPYQCSNQTKEVCLADHPAGDWWYALNDGCMDVGPFISEAAGVEAAKNALEHFRSVMGGRVFNVAVRRLH